MKNLDFQKLISTPIERRVRFMPIPALGEIDPPVATADGQGGDVPGLYVRGLTGSEYAVAEGEADSGDFFDDVVQRLLSNSPSVFVEGLRKKWGASPNRMHSEKRLYISVLRPGVIWDEKTGDDVKTSFGSWLFEYFYFDLVTVAQTILRLTGQGHARKLEALQAFKDQKYKNALILCYEKGKFLYEAYPHLVNGANFCTDFEQTLWSEFNKENADKELK